MDIPQNDRSKVAISEQMMLGKRSAASFSQGPFAASGSLHGAEMQSFSSSELPQCARPSPFPGSFFIN